MDESHDVGILGTKDLIKKEGFGRAYLNHYKKIIETLVKYGKKKIFLYHDISSHYPEVLNGLPKDHAVFVYWDYDAKPSYGNMPEIAKSGISFIVSSSALNWARIFPEIDQSIKSNQRLMEEGLKYGAIGESCSSWGDNGNEDLRDNRLFPFAGSASMAWNVANFNQTNFTRVFFMTIFGNYTPEIQQMWDNLCHLDKHIDNTILKDFQGHLWRHPFPYHPLGDDLDLTSKLYSEDFMENERKFYKETLDLIEKIRPTIRRNEISLDCKEVGAFGKRKSVGFGRYGNDY
jgi:hypothetical protein